MPPKNNPLGLNPLQSRTLVLLQALAADSQSSQRDDDSGEVRITHLPHAHGDHLHVGNAVVSARDATGLGNESVWRALERKGLVRADFPRALWLTPAGLSYELAIAGEILHDPWEGDGH